MKKILFALVFTAGLFYGCAKDIKGPVYLQPSEKGPEGYSQAANKGVFENDLIRISVAQLKKEGAPQDEMIADLLKKDYILVRMEIENLSGDKIRYNPVYTVLSDDAFDYRKPLDYTDLYDSIKDKPGAEKKLSRLKGSFYDLGLTLKPGESSSRLLIFKPLTKGIKKATLEIKEIYAGTGPLRLSFPFTAEQAL